MNITRWYQIGFVLMALGVVAGAFGAHTLKSVLQPASLQAWQTAVLYHLVHTIGLLLLLRLVGTSALMRWSVWLMAAGLICFSGSLYLLACKDLISFRIDFIGPITPLGGVAWIGAWICAALGIKSAPTQ
jgi:uncharacterized membrane protein YgdD (TMEM256/DUF423 family)